jgi:diguanylate cyclase (GGDEF)-like protein
MQTLSGMQVLLLGPGVNGQPQILVSTLGGDATASAALSGDSAVVAGVAMVTRRIPLADGSSVVLLRSVAEAVAPYRDLQWLLLAISLIGLAVFALGNTITARHVTTPLRMLVDASVRLGRGDYTQTIGNTDRPDEIGELAQAFDHMRINIAAQSAEVRRLAYWDHLTGLPNRAQFRDAMQTAIDGSAHSQGQMAIVMLDLDRFKHVNDVLGYAFGNQLLKAVADRLVGQVVRTGDLVARLSGDEFALLLPGADAVQAIAVAERIATVFEQPVLLENQTVDISASYGIACYPAHASDADALLSRAEVAMYSAKRKTASAQVYDPSIDAGSALTLSLLSELRRALELNELRLFLQPKLALDSGRLVGAEALVRWQHPSRGLMPPILFIPFAEQTGFVRQLTLWIFEATARAWPLMKSLGIRRVSVNLSARDLMDQELPAKLDAILTRHRMKADVFCLEITESAIMDDPQRAESTLNMLSAAGFKLSIDDFGTGYSSLAYLKRLPVDELKIDKSFVMGMESDVDDAKIVRSTIDLAHNMGLSVVAEGVESAGAWNLLRELGCDEAQGYHMSRPLPQADLAAFAARWEERVGERASAALH